MKVLMIEEKFRHEGQILTVDWVFGTINLENCHLFLLIAVNLIPWRVVKWTRLTVTFQFLRQSEEIETKLANIETVDVMIVNWVGTVVPSFRHVLSKLNSRNRFEFRIFLMSKQFSVVHT